MAAERGHIRPKAHVALRLGERRYAIDLTPVQEIVHSPELDPCLDGPELLVGMFDSATGALPVLDLLGRPPDECPLSRMALVILQVSNTRLCLIADELPEMVELDPANAVPLLRGANGAPDELLRGVVDVGGCDYYLLDLDQIVLACSGAGPGRGEGVPK
jgi:chemotaxis signal transduction protein